MSIPDSKTACSQHFLWSHPPGVVKGETVLWTREKPDGEAVARLLFAPRRILRLYRANRTESYDAGQVEFKGRRLSTKLPVPGLLEAELFPATASARTIERHSDGVRFVHFSEGHYFHDLQVCVDYETGESWDGPVPAGQGGRLARVGKCLREGKSLRLAVLGDSISTGANASGRCDVAPRQPGYARLLADRLGGKAGGGVLDNFSQGGKTAAWGLGQAEAVIRARPDLLVVAFGMNDASEGVSPVAFAETVRSIIDAVRNGSPETDFLVVSGMSPNPEWHLARPGLRETCHAELCGQAGDGVAVGDVRSVWNQVVARKGFWSMTGNGVNHPNDFGHRLYADCLEAALTS